MMEFLFQCVEDFFSQILKIESLKAPHLEKTY